MIWPSFVKFAAVIVVTAFYTLLVAAFLGSMIGKVIA